MSDGEKKIFKILKLTSAGLFKFVWFYKKPWI